MSLLSDNNAIRDVCRRYATFSHVCVDTEFVRDRTYFPVLCLIQIGCAGEAVAIDALAPGIDLAPVFELIANPDVLKVLHSCRQDMEVFFHATGALPAPVFDTQIAAMVCGHGDAISYDRLVAELTGHTIDKTSRFTDWSRRPLSRKQLDYALSDVIYLQDVYSRLDAELTESGRVNWVEEELANVTNPATYQVNPREMWQRIRYRNRNRRFLARVRELACWREIEAQKRNLPSNWVLREPVLLEIAARNPATQDDLAAVRTISRDFANGKRGRELLNAVVRANALANADCPDPPQTTDTGNPQRAVADLLRVLLKHKSEEHDVAQKLIASTADLDALAADDAAPVPALQGWRRTLFGDDALLLKQGKLALAGDGDRVRLIRL